MLSRGSHAAGSKIAEMLAPVFRAVSLRKKEVWVYY